MQFEDYRERLSARLFSNFDLYRDITLDDLQIDMMASFKKTTERYVLLKKNVQYRFNTFEYFYLIQQESLSLDQLKNFMERLTDHIVQSTEPDQDHMSSDHTVIFHVKENRPEVAEYVQKYIFRKMFKLGFYGWVHIGLVVVDTNGKIVFSKHRKQKPYRFLDVQTQ